MKNKYNILKKCSYCGNEFVTSPRFLDYCSQKCKNPLNRGEYEPWNKGIKLTEEQKAKQNIEGLKKGWGWNKGIPNKAQSDKWTINNPNKDGRINNMRPKNYVDDEFTAYKRECKKVTYRSRYAMKKEGVIPANIGKRKDQYQLDHIIPFRQGFQLGIDSKIIGGRKNLQWILGEENRTKWDRFQSEDIINKVLAEQKEEIQTISEQTKQKMSEVAKGRKFSDEHRLKLAQARKGKIPWNKGLTVTDDRVKNSMRNLPYNKREQV